MGHDREGLGISFAAVIFPQVLGPSGPSTGEVVALELALDNRHGDDSRSGGRFGIMRIRCPVQTAIGPLCRTPVAVLVRYVLHVVCSGATVICLALSFPVGSLG